LIQFRGVLEQLPMVLGYFVMFSFHFKSCNSSLPENKQFLGAFDVIQCKIMQIGKAEHLKRIWEDNR